LEKIASWEVYNLLYTGLTYIIRADQRNVKSCRKETLRQKFVQFKCI